MSILSGFSKIKRYKKINDNDYKLQSQWTSASTVEMDNGMTLQETLNSLNINSGSSVANTKAGCLKNESGNVFSRYNMFISKDEEGVIYISGVASVKRLNAPSSVTFNIAKIKKQDLIDMGIIDTTKSLTIIYSSGFSTATTYSSDGETYKVGMSEFSVSSTTDGWTIQISPPVNTRNIVVPFSFFLS